MNVIWLPNPISCLVHSRVCPVFLDVVTGFRLYLIAGKQSRETDPSEVAVARMLLPVAHVLTSSAADVLPQWTPLPDTSPGRPAILSAIPGSRH